MRSYRGDSSALLRSDRAAPDGRGDPPYPVKEFPYGVLGPELERERPRSRLRLVSRIVDPIPKHSL